MRPRVKPGGECRCAGKRAPMRAGYRLARRWRRADPADRLHWHRYAQGQPVCMSWLSKGQAGITVYTIESRDRLVGQFSELGGPGILSEEVLTRTEQK